MSEIFDFMIMAIYNLVTIVVFIVWLLRENHPLEDWIREGSIKKWSVVVTIWIFVSLTLNFFVLLSDVDDAVITTTVAFVDNFPNINPYVDRETIHHLPTGDVKGLYHYFPTDLLVYSLIYILFGWLDLIHPIFNTVWFVIGNFIFLCLSYLIVRKILPEVDEKRTFLLFWFLSIFFIFTNSSLMLLYFCFGFYVLKYFSQQDIGYLGYVFAAGVKYITGLLMIVHLFEDLKSVKKLNDFTLVLKPYITSGLIFFVILIPFGLVDVLKATFLYQGDVSARSEVAAIHGPLLVEIVNFFGLTAHYNIFFLLGFLASLGVALSVGKSTYEKQMLFIVLILFVLPFYGSEFVIIPVFLWLFSIFGIEYNFPESSALQVTEK